MNYPEYETSTYDTYNDHTSQDYTWRSLERYQPQTESKDSATDDVYNTTR